MAVREPAEYADEIERAAALPAGSSERFFGYGVMGLPFASGHILGLRRFPASSIGPGYRSVWHRDPGGRWTFYQDQPAELACTRYFGADVEEVREGPIEISWTGPRSFELSAGSGELVWTLELASTPVTSALNDGPRPRAGSAGRLRNPSAWRVRRRARVVHQGACVAQPMLGAKRDERGGGERGEHRPFVSLAGQPAAGAPAEQLPGERREQQQPDRGRHRERRAQQQRRQAEHASARKIAASVSR
jgi:hypothetical protein